MRMNTIEKLPSNDPFSKKLFQVKSDGMPRIAETSSQIPNVSDFLGLSVVVCVNSTAGNFNLVS